MNELNKIGDLNQVFSNIDEEIKSTQPSSNRIITYLYDLRTKEEFQGLSDSKFYDFIGEVFKLNPEYFMKHIYGASRLYEKVNKKEMEKYIIEKFCLYEGEQILYECNGELKETNPTMKVLSTPVKASVDGRIYVTNYRIIAHGKLSARGGRWWGFGLLDLAIASVTGGTKRDKSKIGMIEGSTTQELPCYGFQFKTKDNEGLKKKKDGIQYTVIVDKVENISITSSIMKQTKAITRASRIVRITLTHPNEEQIGHLFELLCRDINQVLNTLREIHEMRLPQERKQMEFLRKLQPFLYFPYKGNILSKLQGDDIHQFSDSDYFEIVKEAYKLDPEFFMTSIYPEMMSWKHWKRFLSTKDVKEEVKSLVEILKKNHF